MEDFDDTKRYKDGLRENLRPNSMWADERYVNVTHEESEQARERVSSK